MQDLFNLSVVVLSQCKDTDQLLLKLFVCALHVILRKDEQEREIASNKRRQSWTVDFCFHPVHSFSSSHPISAGMIDNKSKTKVNLEFIFEYNLILTLKPSKWKLLHQLLLKS